MRRFGLIGKTLKHSFSKNFFTQKFLREGLDDCSYENFELSSIEDLAGILNLQGLEGLNVTIPFKTEVLPILNEQDDLVKKIAACNCIRIRKGQLKGFNTDAMAFRTVFVSRIPSVNEQVMVLGTGGASRAVQFIIKELGMPYSLVTRSPGKDLITYESLDKNIIANHKVIINTTPLGMFPDIDTCPEIPYEGITKDHVIFDLTYNPIRTKFLQLGASKGAITVNGYEMLVKQAEESWRIWQEG